MSNICTRNSNDFKLVSYKKRNKSLKKTTLNGYNLILDGLDESTTLKRIQTAKEEILSSDLYSSTLASLREGLDLISNPQLTEIICLGLGRVCESMIARYQLALLLCLRDKFNSTVKLYDPQFSEIDRKVLTELKCTVLTENCEGKYEALKVTLFFLPHCPKQLTNNLLYSNWSVNLVNCIIIANSFNKIRESNSEKTLLDCAEYIWNILPYTEEFAIINSFKYFEIFNDLAIHVFCKEKLNILASEFWNLSKEPKYNTDVEFIAKSLSRL